jgi:putrescine aminotransferase
MEFPRQEIGWQVASGLFKRGVLVAGTYSKAQVIRIEPALNIPATLLEELLNRLEDTLKEVAGKLRLGPPTSSQPHEAVR